VVSNIQSFISPSEMTAKIQDFDYNNSIISKVSSSKFIISFNSKISFILQYVCILERYFSKNFLSCLREELMMESTITTQPITSEDLNPQYFQNIAPGHQQHDSSFSTNVNLSKLMSSSKLFINNQFSISEYSNVSKTREKIEPNPTESTSTK
jgi:hypothetical protein